MNIHVRIEHHGENVPLSEAIQKGYIQINKNNIEAQPDTILSLSSRLFDCNGEELFENDIVQLKNGKQYKIVYDFGMFYLYDLQEKKITPMYIYKAGNTIDVEKIIF